MATTGTSTAWQMARSSSQRDERGIRLGGRSGQRAHSQVVGARRLRGQRLPHGLHRHADDLVRPQKIARVRAGGVVLADMHAVCLRLESGLHVVVHDERHPRPTAQRQNGAGERHGLLVRGVLLAQLHERGTACKHLGHAAGQTRDRPATCGPSPHRAPSPGAAFPVDTWGASFPSKPYASSSTFAPASNASPFRR